MKILIRMRQFILSLLVRLIKQKEPEVYRSLNDFPQKVKELNINKVLVVTTKGFISRKTLDNFFKNLEKNKIEYEIYSEVEKDPTIETIENVVCFYRENNCKAIIGIGGGSVIDCSKVAAARLVCKKTIEQMRGLLKIRKKIIPLFIAPTTAGTGSEVTSAAVVTDIIDNIHYKYAISDPSLIPKYVTLDPYLLITLPKNMTATTGMDALTHAIEAYINKFASKKVKLYSKEAVKIIFENLEKSYFSGEDIKLRERMLKASYYAGIAFSHNFVGYVHALSHAIGAIYGLGHGEVNAKLLPVVLENYKEKVYKPLAELSDVVGIKGMNNKDKTEKFINFIKEMNKSMNISNKIDKLKREDFDLIINRALKEANPIYPVPEIWTREKILKVLEKVL